ncbi:hypothetical protein [Roseixanthobacter pseudopolyaromaticivorans]|uniref:hypothetical protein n=1 Tax=Xanthobacteraceae TaxID=335928 RepID=UPI0037279A8B
MPFPQNQCCKSQNPCEREMTASSVSVEMSMGLRRLAEPVHAGESVKALIAKVSRKTGFGYNRAFDLWYGRGRVRAEELDRVRGLMRAHEEAQLNGEIAELRARLSRLEELASLASPPMDDAANG